MLGMRTSGIVLWMLLGGLLGVGQAQPAPSETLFLWGIQRNCSQDQELTRAVQERLGRLGSKLIVLDAAQGKTGLCVGTECADQLKAACGAVGIPAGTEIIGGHVEEQKPGDNEPKNRYLARVRLWRVKVGADFPSVYYRYERVDIECKTPPCGLELPQLVATWAGQLLSAPQPSTQSAAEIHGQRSPFCQGNRSVPPFLCAPFNLIARCGGLDAPVVSGPMECPFRAASAPVVPPPPRPVPPIADPIAAPRPAPSVPAPAACSCQQPALCSARARAACEAVATGPRSPLLRKALGGSMIALGGGLLLGGFLATLNQHTDLTLRADASCGPNPSGGMPEKCFMPPGGIAVLWLGGLGLLAGGAATLVDPLCVFKDGGSSCQQKR